MPEEPPGACVAAEPETLQRPVFATRSEWLDWHWQLRNRIREPSELHRRFPTPHDPTEIRVTANAFPMAITPYYASLMRRLDASDPIWRMSVPDTAELLEAPTAFEDPLEEDADMPVPGLVHRYRDRALLLTTDACAVYCRHCTRKRVAGSCETVIAPKRLADAVSYLRAHPEIRDVILSGGDPLTLETAVLERIIAAVRRVESVDTIRIGTRAPVTLPMRITDELTRMLRRYHPIYVNTHFNHPSELGPLAIEALHRLADAGIPLGNQSVLLRGVNDDPATFEALCRGLYRNRVRPYYLFQCDLVRGVEHFRTPLSRGIEIVEHLRGRLSGLAIPTFVVDAPGGGGKIPLLPTYILSTSPTHTVLRNYEGLLFSYPEPGVGVDSSQGPARAGVAPTVADLAAGRAQAIRPGHCERMDRRSQQPTQEGPSRVQRNEARFGCEACKPSV